MAIHGAAKFLLMLNDGAVGYAQVRCFIDLTVYSVHSFPCDSVWHPWSSSSSVLILEVSWTPWMAARVTTELDESRHRGELPSIETILQKIGTELSMEREIQREASSSLSKAAAQLFTGQLCGTARVHWLVSCAYIACPLSSLLVLVVATEAWWEIGDLEILVVSGEWLQNRWYWHLPTILLMMIIDGG